MARFEVIEAWPGSILYKAAHGRLYCVAPRGLIPDHPYTIDALRPPSPQEKQAWGPGVLPRMVLDVTELRGLARAIHDKTLTVAPWNAYLVLRVPDNGVIVAYRLRAEMPRLDKASAGEVAIASGYDVAGWSTQVIPQFGGERWHFSPPSRDAVPTYKPARSAFTQ